MPDFQFFITFFCGDYFKIVLYYFKIARLLVCFFLLFPQIFVLDFLQESSQLIILKKGK